MNRRCVILLFCCLALPWTGVLGDVRQADIEALTRAPHRLAGTPHGDRAAGYVRQRLEQLGADRVLVQEFACLRSRLLKCRAVLPDGDLRLYPVRANGIMHPVAPEEGLRGELVHVGRGSVADLRGMEVRDRVAVLDFDCDRGWLRVFRLGARAVIFVRDETPDTPATTSHWLTADVNLPRFYHDGPAADLPDGEEVSIECEVIHEPAVGRNVFAFVRGSDPVFTLDAPELVVLAAPRDSFGEVPVLAAGARGAANTAGLLSLAETLVRNRPRRDVLIASLDAEAQCHAGARAFYRVFADESRKVAPRQRRERCEAELAGLESLRALLSLEAPLGDRGKEGYIALHHRVSRLAEEHAARVDERMHRLRNRLIELRRTGDDEPDREDRLSEVRAQLHGQLRPEKDIWNDLRRALGKGDLTVLNDAARDRLRSLLAETGDHVTQRKDELDAVHRQLEMDGALLELFGTHRIVLHASLLLGDSGSSWAVVTGGESILHAFDDQAGQYANVQRAFSETNAARPHETFEPRSVDGSMRNVRDLVAGPHLLHSGEVAGLAGVRNVVLASCQDLFAREGLPCDTVDRLDRSALARQLKGIRALLFGDTQGAAGVLDHVSLSRRGLVDSTQYLSIRFEGGQPVGPTVMGVLAGSAIPNEPVSGAVVHLNRPQAQDTMFQSRKPPAFSDMIVLQTDHNGMYPVGPMRKPPYWSKQIPGFAAEFDERGQLLRVSDSTSAADAESRLNVFACRADVLLLPPREHRDPPGTLTVINALADTPLLDTKSYSDLRDGVLSSFCESSVAAVKVFDLDALVALGGARDDANPRETVLSGGTGSGLTATGPTAPVVSAERAARDLWRLNEARLDVLRSREVLESSLGELHGRAEDLLLDSADAADAASREALAASAWLAERPVYRTARGSLDDLVQAVLILLALSVPFAFALERVLVGSPTIYGQVGWFAGFFAITFLLLYFSHPAFAVANTPVIVFLGFVIILLAGTVIFVLMRRFESELMAVQGMRETVHATDVSRVSTVMAALLMGISTMRRRPLRTALTAVTIILLTFTILSFASFERKLGVLTAFVGSAPGYSAVQVRDTYWRPLNESLVDVVTERWRGTAEVCSRWWVAPRQKADTAFQVSGPGGRSVLLKGVLGVENRELARRDDLASVLGTDLAGGVAISRVVAEMVKASEGDTVVVRGHPLKVARVLSSADMLSCRDMDSTPILPLDFSLIETMQGDAGGELAEAALLNGSSESWSPLPADAVVIVSADTARDLGAQLHGLLLYTADSTDTAETAEDLARMLDLPITGTRADGVYRHVLGSVLQASGVADLAVPVLLGGLVIFGTMLASVDDREREIYTFSALGLGPPHVATLFFAEASVYSVLGGMGGYFLAQGTVKVLTILAGYGAVTVPDMNFSSTNAIGTILLVMATVMASAVYPAFKASRSANPGLARSWAPPSPDGDVLELVFPFTVSAYDITGVVSFLKEHFDNHTTAGLGQFIAQNASLQHSEGGQLGLTADLALAPFDLGVSEQFEMHSAPSRVPGIDEVIVRVSRKSGLPKDWMRLNKRFLDDLRRQFLIWRSLRRETMETYRERTLTEIVNLKSDTHA